MNLIEFISQELYQCRYHDIPPDSDFIKHFLRFGNQTLKINGIQYVIKERRLGWLNNEIRYIFIGSINFHNGFGSNTLPSSPPLYAVNVFSIIQLFKFGECSPSNQYKLSLYDKYFENKMKTSSALELWYHQ